MLLSAPLIDSPWPGVAFNPGEAPITVRIAPVPVLTPGFPVSPEPEEQRTPLPATVPVEGAEGSLRARVPPGAAQPAAETPTLPPAPDPHYYPARDLDSYPRPLAPLRFDRPAGSGAGEVRLDILVDERGVVQDVIFAGPTEPGRANEGLRSMLAATHFLPARKDGRAVKSRVTLSIDFTAEGGGR